MSKDKVAPDKSGTPITDAAAFKQGGRYVDEHGKALDPEIELVHAHVARKLETNRGELKAALREVLDSLGALDKPWELQGHGIPAKRAEEITGLVE